MVLDPDDSECEQFTLDMFSPWRPGGGNTLFDWPTPGSGEDEWIGSGDRQSILDAIFVQSISRNGGRRRPVRGARVLSSIARAASGKKIW